MSKFIGREGKRKGINQQVILHIRCYNHLFKIDRKLLKKLLAL